MFSYQLIKISQKGTMHVHVGGQFLLRRWNAVHDREDRNWHEIHFPFLDVQENSYE